MVECWFLQLPYAHLEEWLEGARRYPVSRDYSGLASHPNQIWQFFCQNERVASVKRPSLPLTVPDQQVRALESFLLLGTFGGDVTHGYLQPMSQIRNRWNGLLRRMLLACLLILDRLVRCVEVSCWSSRDALAALASLLVMVEGQRYCLGTLPLRV
jgi:hypothetical protein